MNEAQMQEIWAIASDMADDNNVEEAWFLRGVADALAGEDAMTSGENPEYFDDYMAGYKSASGR